MTEEIGMENLLVEVAEFIRDRFFGKYRGVVTDVDDPDNLGRIRASVPEIYGDEVDSPWALPCVPFAGQDHGLILLPEVGDGVWIEFEAGDISRPIWSGTWWASGEMPACGTASSRALVTSGGHKIILDDENGKLQLIHSGGAEMTMTDQDITIKLGSKQIVLSSTSVTVNGVSLEVM